MVQRCVGQSDHRYRDYSGCPHRRVFAVQQFPGLLLPERHRNRTRRHRCVHRIQLRDRDDIRQLNDVKMNAYCELCVARFESPVENRICKTRYGKVI